MEDMPNRNSEAETDKVVRFERLSEDNIGEFMERKIQDFSNRYTELYSETLEIDKDALQEQIRSKLKNSYDSVSIEDVIGDGKEQVKITGEGMISHTETGDPLIAASFRSNRSTGKSGFIFKPYADHDDVLITKTIYHEFLHALGYGKRLSNNGEEVYSSGVAFDYDSRYVSNYNPFEEGFSEIIAAEMAGVPPQNYTYEVPVCAMMRQIIGDKAFLQVKNGDVDLLSAEFSKDGLRELRNILSVYDIGIRSRLDNIKYIDVERKVIDGHSTEAIVNDYAANESYVVASKRLSEYLTRYFAEKINSANDQQGIDAVSNTITKCQETENKILPPNNYYESSIHGINQAIINAKAALVAYCDNKNLHISEANNEFSPKYTQNREEVLLDYSVSDLQLQILEQEINEASENQAPGDIDMIIAAAKKWTHSSIEVQKKYRKLYPSFKNVHFNYNLQLEAIRIQEPNYIPKYPQIEGATVDNTEDHTFLTDSQISFTAGGYHGNLPDYGYLIAHSLNTQLEKKIFGDYVVPVMKLCQQIGIESDFDVSKALLPILKATISEKEEKVIVRAKDLSADDSRIGDDVKEKIGQLGDLKINDFIRLQIQ